jgi:hypothetical protein
LDADPDESFPDWVDVPYNYDRNLFLDFSQTLLVEEQRYEAFVNDKSVKATASRTSISSRLLDRDTEFLQRVKKFETTDFDTLHCLTPRLNHEEKISRKKQRSMSPRSVDSVESIPLESCVIYQGYAELEEEDPEESRRCWSVII